MPGIGQGGFDILSLVERRVVHDDHASGREFGQKILRSPRMKDVSVDIGCEQAHGQERLFNQGTDDIGSASCMPIFYAMATRLQAHSHACAACREQSHFHQGKR